jgi:hypothetical protein
VQPAGPLLVVGLGVLQLADSLPVRADLRDWAHRRPPWVLEADALRPMLAGASRLTLLPSWVCIGAGDLETFNQVHQALLLASERALPVSTMQLARWREPPRCEDPTLAAAPFAAGELRLILPAALETLLPLVPEAELRCRMIGIAMACLDPPLVSAPEPAAVPPPPPPLEPVPQPAEPRSADDAPPDRGDGSSSR